MSCMCHVHPVTMQCALHDSWNATTHCDRPQSMEAIAATLVLHISHQGYNTVCFLHKPYIIVFLHGVSEASAGLISATLPPVSALLMIQLPWRLNIFFSIRHTGTLLASSSWRLLPIEKAAAASMKKGRPAQVAVAGKLYRLPEHLQVYMAGQQCSGQICSHGNGIPGSLHCCRPRHGGR